MAKASIEKIISNKAHGRNGRIVNPYALNTTEMAPITPAIPTPIEKNSNNVLFVGDGVLDKECAFKFGIDFACIRNKSNESWSFKEVLNFKDNSALLNFLI